MVKIIGITFDRSAACICLDSGEKYRIRRCDLPSSGFREGMELDQEEFSRRIRNLQYPRALNISVSMLARRPCSKGEIRSRLIARHFTEDVADLAVYKLEKEHLLDDTEFCVQWVRSRMARNYGPAFIRRELRMKGIPEDMAESAIAGLAGSDDGENAVTAARKAWKRIRSGGDIRKDRQKVISSLVRRGFDWDTAKTACLRAENDE